MHAYATVKTFRYAGVDRHFAHAGGGVYVQSLAPRMTRAVARVLGSRVGAVSLATLRSTYGREVASTRPSVGR